MLSGVKLRPGPGRLEPVLRIDGNDRGVQYVEVKKLT